jgi:hypothetical protein
MMGSTDSGKKDRMGARSCVYGCNQRALNFELSECLKVDNLSYVKSLSGSSEATTAR